MCRLQRDRPVRSAAEEGAVRRDVKARDGGQSWARLSHGSGITVHRCRESKSEPHGFIC